MYQYIENEFLNLFDDPKKARLNLNRIIENVPDTHTVFLKRLQYELQQNPAPDDVLNYFEQLTRSVINKISFYKMLCDFPPIIARLVRIFTSSRFLSELITRDFQYTYFLIRPDQDCKPFDQPALERSIKAIMFNTTYSVNRKMEQLRILKRREVLKIGIRDYILDDPLEATARAISTLADELIRAATTISFQELSQKSGSPPAEFAVIALGKLGGQELNYSSDIDLMFVYREEGVMVIDGHELSYHEYFNTLSQKLVSSITYSGREGQLYRVDTRLRPDGDSGPLARCISGFMHYYETRGQLWERQMLIKARCVAGDVDFGSRFLVNLAPFIYPKTFFESPLKEIAHMKWRIEEQKSTDKLDIKICPGGIRDIEFILQALQLINGGKAPDIRTGHTLTGLKKLVENKLLSEDEYRILTENYVFYRKIEHILQISEDRQIHSLSGETKEISKIAFLLNIKNPDDFVKQLDSSREKVREIYRSIFEMTPHEPVQNELQRIFLTDTLTPVFSQKLREAGFQSPANAYRILRLLYFGQFPKLYSIPTQESFLNLLPLFIEEIHKTPDPDHTLMNFERLVIAYPFTDMLYKTLRDRRELLQALIHLSVYSHTFTNVLCDAPSSLDYFISHYSDWMNESDYSSDREFVNFKHIPVFKNMEFIKLVLQFRNGKIQREILYKNLSRLADLILDKIFAKHFSPRDAIAVIGLGKLGGCELSFKSDLDVVFVCDDHADVDDMITKSKNFLNEIMEIGERGRLYEIDARLRPEGKQAPLVVTVSRYSGYIETRAMLWERQALIKARYICGDRSVSEKILNVFSSAVFEKEFTLSDIHAVVNMRQRQMKEKIKTVSDVTYDIKFSRGALLDIEYLVQAYQMKFGKKYGSIANAGNTIDAICELEKNTIISEKDAKVLIYNYLILRELEVYNYLVFDRKSNKIPSDEKQLAFLGNFCKFNKDNRLVERLSQIKKEIEFLFSKLIRELEYGK
jgi:glutamate-ammonia-ligase adenylyltransferase